MRWDFVVKDFTPAATQGVFPEEVVSIWFQKRKVFAFFSQLSVQQIPYADYRFNY